jgi:hypothetical protein
MDNRKNAQSGRLNGFALVVGAAIAICATGAVLMLLPAAATSGSSTANAAPAASTAPAGYFPNQYVNQGAKMEPIQDYSY